MGRQWKQVTFQVPMQYCSLKHRTLLLSLVTSTAGHWFCFGSIPSFSRVISPLISSSILGTYWPGEFLFQCPIILPFHTVYGVLKARILKWFAIPFSSGPCFVRTLHHDLSVLGNTTWHGHSFIELEKVVIHVITEVTVYFLKIFF